jgi:8-oxo-dGTP diphosphatase
MTTAVPTIRVVAGAIIRDKKVLAAQRPFGTLSLIAGKWEMPGGKVDPGENDVQALMREMQEELMVDVRVGACLGTTNITQAHRVIRLTTYACELVGGEPVAVEHADLRWVGTMELENMDWASGDRQFLPVVRDLIAGRTLTPDSVGDGTPLPTT